MENQTIYKKRFLNKLDKLLAYLVEEWNAKVADEFLDKFEEKLKILKLHPTVGKLSGIKNLRSVVVGKGHQNKIYYRIENNKIVVLNMIDTRKNPKTNPFNKQL